MTGAGTGGSLQHPQGERDQPRERGSGEAGRGHDTLLPGHVWTVDSSYMYLASAGMQQFHISGPRIDAYTK